MSIHENLTILPNIKKHNALTDGYLNQASKAVLPDKLINVLYWKYEECGEEFTLAMAQLRKLLGLKSIKDDTRIYAAVKVLQHPIQLRDFTYKNKQVDWISAPFLNRAVIWKTSKNMIDFRLDDMMVEALKQKAGYTPLKIDICNQFKTKYGLKLYEMIMRYYSLPNKEGKGVGTVSKSLTELNNMFGTTYKTRSEILRGITRGLKETEKITHELVTCFFDEKKQKFIFSWYQQSKYPKLRIPFNRIDELINWYIQKNKSIKMQSVPRYKHSLKSKIIDDTFLELDSYYRGLMIHRYDLNPDDYLNDGNYTDFKLQQSYLSS